VIDQRDVSGLAVGIVAHEDAELAAAFEGGFAVANKLAVADKEVIERRAA
jgi:hypothetical protein